MACGSDDRFIFQVFVILISSGDQVLLELCLLPAFTGCGVEGVSLVWVTCVCLSVEKGESGASGTRHFT